MAMLSQTSSLGTLRPFGQCWLGMAADRDVQWCLSRSGWGHAGAGMMGGGQDQPCSCRYFCVFLQIFGAAVAIEGNCGSNPFITQLD